MKLTYFIALAVGTSMLLTGCTSGSASLKELADVYAEIADNNTEMADAVQAVYKVPRDQQQALQEKASSISETVKAKNEELANKAASIGERLQGQEIKCEASEGCGFTVKNATFTTVNAQDKLANIVVTAEFEGTPNGTLYFSLMAGKEELYKSAARVDGETITMNFRITTNKGSEVARLIGKTQSIMLTSSSNGGGLTDDNDEPEPAYTDEDNGKSVEESVANGVKIEKGANLVAVLKAAKSVTYEYNADSGIWAYIGSVSICIDEEQLNQKGVEFMKTIYSDIEPNLNFSIDYLKPDAKILTLEKN